MDEPTQTLNPAALAAQIDADAPRVAESAAEAQAVARAQSAAQTPLAPALESAAPAPQVRPPVSASDILRDASGRAWDGAKYRVNADGTPYLNKQGRYMPAPRLRSSTQAPRETQAEMQSANAPISAPEAEALAEGTAPAWTDEERADALKSQSTAQAQSAPDAQNAAPARPSAANAEATAEVASNALYTLTGAVLNNHKAARPGVAEHGNIKKTIAAYFIAKGVVFGEGVAVLIVILAYLIGEERREVVVERVKAAFSKLRQKAETKIAPPAQTSAHIAPAAAPQPVRRPAIIPL